MDIAKLLTPEYMLIWKEICKIDPVLREKCNFKEPIKANTFIGKGAKGAAKTYSMLVIAITLMIVNPHQSWMVSMETKSENLKKTIPTILNLVSKVFEPEIKGIRSKFVDFRSESRMAIEYNNGSWKQTIDFTSLDELGSGGHAPPPHTYYGLICDDVLLRKTANNTTFDTHINALTAIRNFKLSTQRHLNQFGATDIITFITLNPFAGNSPWLEKFNTYLPDDNEKQVVDLFRYEFNEIDKEMYYTVSLEANPFTTQNDIAVVDRGILSWSEYLTEKYGLNSYGRDSVLGYLWGFINQFNKDLEYISQKEYIPYSIGVDVGGFGHESAATVMSLVGWHEDTNHFCVIEEEVFNPKTDKPVGPEKLASRFIHTLIRWTIKYPLLEKPLWNYKININVDPTDSQHSYFADLMMDMYRREYGPVWQSMQSNPNPLSNLEFRLAVEKWYKKWDGIARAFQIETIISRGLLRINPNWSPFFYNQLPLMKIVNGKRNDNDMDAIQSVEYALSDIMRFYVRDNEVLWDEINKLIGK